jgi:1-acyl-sn-glycerol-3-phosphate acyltransferase
VLPGRPVSLMFAGFYDLPVLRWLMPRYGAIRVPDIPVRREAPEIAAAIAVLKRGEAMLIFPEGWLRRHEERPVRRFGRGVWQILRECPEVPVYALWIEGGWGSFTSWKDGPPGKNKRLDWRRPITVAVPEPVVVPRELLDDHLATRQFLLGEVVKARAILGLPPLEPPAPGEDEVVRTAR